MTFATYWYVLLGAVGGALNAALLTTRRPEHRGEPLLRQFRDMGLVTAAEYRRLVKDLG